MSKRISSYRLGIIVPAAVIAIYLLGAAAYIYDFAYLDGRLRSHLSPEVNDWLDAIYAPLFRLFIPMRIY